MHDTFAIDDPDGLIRAARWFEPDEAIRVLRQSPYLPLAEPAIGYLDGSVAPGSLWSYPAADLPGAVTPPR